LIETVMQQSKRPFCFSVFTNRSQIQMNRIKIIKRTSLQSPLETGDAETKKVNETLIKPRAGKVVENWINEWRASQPKDSRLAFAALFGNSPAASGYLTGKF
jgi:hypothetical protein